ncbi:DoxX family protein [uncultured Shewanella sp.]|uniref:DoxX family protein n=1 Tax=uncultured Shewanella sp. TaxID=173975 RepID=UPI0034518CDF
MQRFIKPNPTLAPLVLRVPIGIIFMIQGAQKLSAWFSGYGLDGTALGLNSAGLAPGFFMALFAGSCEFLGGLLIFIGLAVRPTAALLAFTTLVAVITVYSNKGLLIADSGFGLSLVAASLSLMISGAGRLSIDQLTSEQLLNR